MVSGYGDFHRFREAVAERLEPGGWGSRFPVFMLHSDCDGVWTLSEAARLEAELLTIGDELSRLAPVVIQGGWPAQVTREFDLRPSSLRECFFDVDGEPLVDRLLELSRTAQRANREISFQ